jgi:hypothetical protein
VDGARWLLLGHQLPTRSSNARVKTWRRLQQIGAVPARKSVYVLPNTEQCREDFEWIRSEIVAIGGEATVFAAEAISVGGTEDIEGVFRRTREQEYRALKGEIDRWLPTRKSKPRSAAVGSPSKGRLLRGFRDRLKAIEHVDFFQAPGRVETAAALAAFERAVHGRRTPATPAGSPLRTADFKRRRWVTRPRPGVDRMASAWFIRRFVDPDATFAFSDQPEATDVPFDMYSGEFSHQGDSCTFEVLVDRFALHRPAVSKVGDIVHDLDMKDAKYGPPEVAAVGRIVDGLRAAHADDAALLEQGIGVFDALARSFESDEETAGASAAGRRIQRGRSRRRT